MNSLRLELHRLIDELPEAYLAEALRILQLLNDPVTRMMLKAPEEDEELSPEGVAALEEGLRAIERGDVVSDGEVMRQLGLSSD